MNEKVNFFDPMQGVFDFCKYLDLSAGGMVGSTFSNYNVRGSMISIYMPIDMLLSYVNLLETKGYGNKAPDNIWTHKGYAKKGYYFKIGPYDIRLAQYREKIHNQQDIKYLQEQHQDEMLILKKQLLLAQTTIESIKKTYSIMNYTNIIAIYERLYKASDNIKNETIDYMRGFQDCVYLLSLSLKRLDFINLHIENRNLRYRVYDLELRLDDNSEDRHVVFRRNGDLAKENKQLKRDIQALTNKTRARAKTAVSFNPVEIEWEKELITFFINTDSDTFMSHFEKATAYVNLQWARKKFRVYVGAIKCWYLEYYRSLGFICNPK